MTKFRGKNTAALLLFGAAVIGPSALACSPPPPILPFPIKEASETGDDFAKRVGVYWKQEREAQEKQQLAYSKDFEAELWSKAKSITLYQIKSRRSVKQHLAFGSITYTRLMPVKAMRGAKVELPLRLKSEFADTTCGPMRLGDHAEGVIGDPVIIFSFASSPQTDNIARIITLKDALDQRTLSVFEEFKSTKK